VTLWIDQWSGSGFTYDSRRIFSGCPIADLEFSKRQPFNPLDLFQSQDEQIVYRLKQSPKTPYLFWFLQGLGIYSINLYSFLIVLLCEKAFYLTFMKHLKKWWKSLWLVEKDMQTVETRIQNLHDSGPVNKEQILEILIGVHMIHDVTESAWNNLNE
jgi:hypothetical protein